MLIFPNCKINIGLQIISKRSDGFHSIETLFVPISGLCDVLEIQESNQFEFTSFGMDSESLFADNLCVRAYQLMQQAYDLPPVKMHLHKCIPIGAGLGGGSANAAFTLLLLNKFFKLSLDIKKLKTYAQLLGSDCVFFIENKTVLGLEKGDVLLPVEVSALKNKYIYIVKPNVHINTAKAYALAKPEKPAVLLRNLLKSPIGKWKDTISNDFERIIFPNYPVLQSIKNSLYEQGAIYASMSGSGSACYGIFDEKPFVNKEFPSDFFQWIGNLQ